jgi:multidrug efflux pump subunit AcrA (membrane-fusion protein)
MVMPDTVRAAQRPEDLTQQLPGVTGSEGPRRRLPNRRTIVLLVVAVVVVAGAGIGIWLGTSSSSPSALTVTTQVVSVTSGTMQQTVSATGTLAPAQEANLDFAVSGKVTAVDVATGQAVTAGQALATIDPSALQQLADAAQASLSSAQAKLSSDEASGADASQVDSDEAAVTSATSALTTAQSNLADATLTSTVTGMVASVDLSVGQQVTGSGSGASGSDASGEGASSAATGSSSASSSSSAQIVVVATGSYVVSTTVDDTQIGQVKEGDQAVITPSGSTTPVYGTVSSVGLIASQTSGVAAFPVSIAVTGSPSGLYAGASASVSIVVEEIQDALQVPTAAISYGSSGQATVTVVQNGKDVTRNVTTGVAANGETQITSGLSSGDKVVERVVKFNGTVGGGGRSLFGGSGASRGPSGGRVGGGEFGGGLGGGGFARQVPTGGGTGG